MPGTSKPLDYRIAFCPVLFSLVVKLMAGSVGMWGWGVMDRVYHRASVSVL